MPSSKGLINPAGPGVTPLSNDQLDDLVDDWHNTPHPECSLREYLEMDDISDRAWSDWVMNAINPWGLA